MGTLSANFERSNLPYTIQAFEPHGYRAAALLFRHHDAGLTDGLGDGACPNGSDHRTAVGLLAAADPGGMFSGEGSPVLQGEVTLGIKGT
jgi:hypothetical protein